MNGESGTRVVRTGIALVHEGEFVVPAPGSEAAFAVADDEGVHYYFPVEIDVRRSEAAPSAGGASDDAFEALASHLGG